MAQQLRENAITIVSRTFDVDMKTAGTTELYQVPENFTLIITDVMVHSISGSLAGGTDYDIGDTVGGDYFKSTVDLSSLTATNHTIRITNTGINSLFTEDTLINLNVITGSTGTETATIDIFGYLF